MTAGETPASASASAFAPPGWPDGTTPLGLRVVKLAPDGGFVTDYPGEIVPGAAPAPWLCVRAVWDNRLMVLDGLEFRPGDVLLEYFSPTEWFNVFAVHAPDGGIRGWYANVTYPTGYDLGTTPPTLAWRDLFLDVVALPDGRRTLRDEDELADAGLDARDPALLAAILRGRDAIFAHLDRGVFPFQRSG